MADKIKDGVMDMDICMFLGISSIKCESGMYHSSIPTSAALLMNMKYIVWFANRVPPKALLL